MFQVFSKITTELSPKIIKVDFEKAAMYAIHFEFPVAEAEIYVYLYVH